MNCNRVGAWHTILGRSFLSTRFPTLPQLLKKEGYYTAIFGKWHLGDNYPYRPQDRGFDEVLVHGGGGVGQTPDYWNNDYFDDTYFHNGKPEKFNGYCTDIWFDEAIKFIEQKSASKEPFFCYLSTNAPHGPFHVPQKYIDMYAGNANVPNPNFYGMITNVDENVGKLEANLNRLGLDQNTILIYMTDNGTAAGADLDKEGQVVKGFNAKMRGKKGSEYEGGHRVPLFIRFPEQMGIKRDTYQQLVSYNDVLPTILELIDASTKDTTNFDGISFAELLKSGKQDNLKDRILVADTQRNEWPVKGKNSCVMQDQWRLINNQELYNIKEDPSQQLNIIEDNTEIAQTLSQAYEAWWQDIEPDFHFTNRIIIGSEQEKVTLLTAHDWHSDQGSPWNQGMIREARPLNGKWLLEVAKAGSYTVRLHRWPPSLDQELSENVAMGDEVSGGTRAKEGIGLKVESAKLQINDKMVEAKAAIKDKYFQFSLALEQGPADLQTWLITDDQVDRGAYYVEVLGE
jgi:arylsulfatase A-like enzyme